MSTLAAGRIAARREITLRGEIAGTVLRVHHARGDHVAAGETLVTYDVQELRTRLQLAQAAVSTARAQTAQASAAARMAATNATRARGLQEHGAAPAAEAETLEGQREVADRAAETSRVSAAQAAASVQLARDALRRGTVVSPFAGVILTTTVEQGEITVPGAPLLTLADTSDLRVDAELDEADLGRVELGMPAELVLDAYPSRRFTGRLAEIAPGVSRDLRGNRSISIRVDVLPDPVFRVGMSADVDIVVATREQALWVPPNAVQGRGVDRSVFVVEGGFARRRSIEVGISTWEAVEVLRGLREREAVVLTMASVELSDGMAVTVRPTAEVPASAAPRER